MTRTRIIAATVIVAVMVAMAGCNVFSDPGEGYTPPSTVDPNSPQGAAIQTDVPTESTVTDRVVTDTPSPVPTAESTPQSTQTATSGEGGELVHTEPPGADERFKWNVSGSRQSSSTIGINAGGEVRVYVGRLDGSAGMVISSDRETLPGQTFEDERVYGPYEIDETAEYQITVDPDVESPNDFIAVVVVDGAYLP